MKKLIHLSILCFSLLSSGFAQSIPSDSLYLGQIPQDNAPIIFNLPVSSGFFAGARIAISDDGRNIYYNEMNGYGSGNTSRIRNLAYSNNKWTGPFNLFTGYQQPALSNNGDTMFMDKANNPGQSLFFSVGDSMNWEDPINYPVDISSRTSISEVIQSGSNITLKGLNYPLIFALYGNELFLARDNSYCINSEVVSGKAGDLFISYNKTDTTWTNFKDLGPLINTSDWEFAPYVTSDNKYLFFVRSSPTAGTSTYWVKIDELLDSLKLVSGIKNEKGIQFKQEVIIYPNPSENIFNAIIEDISYKDAIIEVYNLTGNLILSSTFHNNQQITIDLHSYRKGIYLIKIYFSNKIISKKILLH